MDGFKQLRARTDLGQDYDKGFFVPVDFCDADTSSNALSAAARDLLVSLINQKYRPGGPNFEGCTLAFFRQIKPLLRGFYEKNGVDEDEIKLALDLLPEQFTLSSISNAKAMLRHFEFKKRNLEEFKNDLNLDKTRVIDHEILGPKQRSDFKKNFKVDEGLAPSFFKRFAPDFEELEHKFPNFADVIAEIRYQIESGCFEPLLLIGPPGTGKTEFARCLPDALNWGLIALNLASIDTPRPVVGSDYTWYNSAPGEIFRHVVEKNADHGVILLDEISHLQSDSRKSYPILPTFLELLDSRNELTDLWAKHTFTTKNFIKIATGNDLSGLNSALLDRFKVIKIKRPCADQRLQILANIVTGLDVAITPDALQKLACSSRSLRKVSSDLKRLAHECSKTDNQITVFSLKNFDLQEDFQ